MRSFHISPYPSEAGVTGFVGPTTEPIALTEQEVEALGVESKSIQVNYAVGDNVKIIHGPLDGFTGQVEEVVVEKNLVKVSVSFFGRSTLYELELGDVQVIEE